MQGGCGVNFSSDFTVVAFAINVQNTKLCMHCTGFESCAFLAVDQL